MHIVLQIPHALKETMMNDEESIESLTILKNLMFGFLKITSEMPLSDELQIRFI